MELEFSETGSNAHSAIATAPERNETVVLEAIILYKTSIGFVVPDKLTAEESYKVAASYIKVIYTK